MEGLTWLTFAKLLKYLDKREIVILSHTSTHIKWLLSHIQEDSCNLCKDNMICVGMDCSICRKDGTVCYNGGTKYTNALTYCNPNNGIITKVEHSIYYCNRCINCRKCGVHLLDPYKPDVRYGIICICGAVYCINCGKGYYSRKLCVVCE